MNKIGAKKDRKDTTSSSDSEVATKQPKRERRKGMIVNRIDRTKNLNEIQKTKKIFDPVQFAKDQMIEMMDQRK